MAERRRTGEWNIPGMAAFNIIVFSYGDFCVSYGKIPPKQVPKTVP